MDVGGYKHNYEGLYEKSTYQVYVNKGIIDNMLFNVLKSCILHAYLD